MPSATFPMSAPAASQRSAIMLINEIFIARNELAACPTELGRVRIGDQERYIVAPGTSFVYRANKGLVDQRRGSSSAQNLLGPLTFDANDDPVRM